MDFFGRMYGLAADTLGYAAFPIIRSKSGDDPDFLRGRFGYYDAAVNAGSVPGKTPSIWLHAASVGEVTGALPTIAALLMRLPDAAFHLTVATPQGFRFAKERLPEGVDLLPFPVDMRPVLDRAFRRLRPDLYVGFESEFWPNLFQRLRRNRIPALLLNGRLTRRSAGNYHLLKPLFEPIFRQFERLAMHSEEDRRNIIGLGARAERTITLGSSKYDGLASRAKPENVQHWRSVLDIPPGTPTVVGGSLRGRERIELPEVFRKLSTVVPKVVGIFVPRHLDRVPDMVRRLNELGIPFQLLSDLENKGEKRRASAIVVDRIGALFDLYGLGDLIFCGGTMEPVGGHNILEPAAWKKAVFYGPHLKKVSYEHRILHSFEGSFLARDFDELEGLWREWIQRFPKLESRGVNAFEALRSMGGVVEKQVEIVMNTLSER